MTDTEGKRFGNSASELADYTKRTFHVHDSAFEEIEKRSVKAGLPQIHLSHFDARLLELLARSAGAKKIVEIGTLAGLSGVSLARALPDDGILHTFEFEQKHADVAKASFRAAGLLDKVRIHVGPALEKLRDIEGEGPFDLVFIDADKVTYPKYLDWAAKNLRIGGLVLADNAFANGAVAQPLASIDSPHRPSVEGISKLNAALGDPTGPWRASMIPTGEGMAIGVKVK